MVPVPTGCSPRPAQSEPVSVVLADEDGIYTHRIAMRDRLSARLHADRWDQELARGGAPESSAPLALHAQTLVSSACRRRLASSLRRILEDAKGGGLPEWNALGPRHHLVHVLPARREIEALIRLLLAPAPVSARGVALVRILLTDGGGPLYRRTAALDLRTEIRTATQAIDPMANWSI